MVVGLLRAVCTDVADCQPPALLVLVLTHDDLLQNFAEREEPVPHSRHVHNLDIYVVVVLQQLQILGWLIERSKKEFGFWQWLAPL